jgi:hypothetical protein
MPEMKQEPDLTPVDFERHPVWIGVHNYDSDEPWYEQSDEETYRPWTGRLPFSENRGIALVAATFKVADGSTYSGYCTAVRENWDEAPPSYTTPSGNKVTPQSWSATHGGTKLSVLDLINPSIFLNGHPFDFHLGVTGRRKSRVRRFYTAIGKQPHDVFPLRFAADEGLTAGITSGKLDGFFYFPMGAESFEIDTGESMLGDDRTSAMPFEGTKTFELDRPSQTVVEANKAGTRRGVVRPELKQSSDLSLPDFERHPVWVRVHGLDVAEPWYSQVNELTYRPWNGPLPVATEKVYARVIATFVLCDGSKYRGYVRAVPENWVDIVPSPRVLRKGTIIEGKSPRVRFGGSPLAIVGEQLPFMFIGGQKFGFWCGVKDVDELRLPFYDAIRKPPDDIFPIHFEGAPGLATGITTGELDGFYEIGFRDYQPPTTTR